MSAPPSRTSSEQHQEYADAVLDLVDSVPSGRVTTYGLIAEAIGARLHRGGPRLVARVMATDGAAVPWWRVVRADGTLPEALNERARPEWLREQTPMRRDLSGPDIRRALWRPSG